MSNESKYALWLALSALFEALKNKAKGEEKPEGDPNECQAVIIVVGKPWDDPPIEQAKRFREWHKTQAHRYLNRPRVQPIGFPDANGELVFPFNKDE